MPHSRQRVTTSRSGRAHTPSARSAPQTGHARCTRRSRLHGGTRPMGTSGGMSGSVGMVFTAFTTAPSLRGSRAARYGLRRDRSKKLAGILTTMPSPASGPLEPRRTLRMRVEDVRASSLAFGRGTVSYDAAWSLGYSAVVRVATLAASIAIARLTGPAGSGALGVALQVTALGSMLAAFNLT